MKGTARQIEWAEDIRRQAIENIEANIKLRAQYDDVPSAATVSAYKIMRAVVDGVFAAHDDAEWIINHRQMLTPSGYRVCVDRWAELISTGRMTAEQIAAQNGLKDYKEV